jgi:CelD/BcsL family acetyltransferase involved in cellulose biosynthesis
VAERERDDWSTRLVPLSDVGEADALQWRALADQAIEPNVYLDPRFLIPAGRRADAKDVRLAFVERAGQLRAVHQFTVGRFEDRWPARVVTTGGAFMSIHADRHHPLVHPDEPSETVAALLRGLRAAKLPGLVLIRYLPADGPLADAFAALAENGHLSEERARRSSAYAYRRGNRSAEPFDTTHLTSSRAKQIRRRARNIETEAGGPLSVFNRGADPAIIEEFLDFQAAGWKGDVSKGGGAFRLDAVHERWYRDVMAGFAADDDVIAPVLAAGDETVFMAIDLVSGGAAFGFIDAYAERFARSAPGALGRLAEWRCVLDSAAIPFFDPAFDPYYAESTKMYPHRRDHIDLLIANDARATGILKALPALRSMRDRARPRGSSVESEGGN